MRHFSLMNSAGEVLDITTKDILFHDISGLGFEEENDFRQVGEFWMLNRTGRRQATVGGSLIFTEKESERLGNTPYEKYRAFVKFASKAPLTMYYCPFGEIDYEVRDEITTFRRTVRVASLDKTEINEYGVLDVPVEFIAYTPWYKVIVKSFKPTPLDPTDTGGWIWGGSSNPPLKFEPVDDQNASRAKFRAEEMNTLQFNDLDVMADCPTKITIAGPLLNPTWTHRVTKGTGVNERTYIAGSGALGSQSDPVSLAAGDVLVIDGTDGNYAIYSINANGTTTNLYSKRDFGLPCFITLEEGQNYLSVTSGTGGVPAEVTVEGHVYYATV